jgi:hypothetical protein
VIARLSSLLVNHPWKMGCTGKCRTLLIQSSISSYKKPHYATYYFNLFLHRELKNPVGFQQMCTKVTVIFSTKTLNGQTWRLHSMMVGTVQLNPTQYSGSSNSKIRSIKAHLVRKETLIPWKHCTMVGNGKGNEHGTNPTVLSMGKLLIHPQQQEKSNNQPSN